VKANKKFLKKNNKIKKDLIYNRRKHARKTNSFLVIVYKRKINKSNNRVLKKRETQNIDCVDQ